MRPTRKKYQALKKQDRYTRKIMRKVKGTWVSALLIGGVVGMSQLNIVNAEPAQLDQTISTTFKDKDKYLENKLVQEEIKKAKEAFEKAKGTDEEDKINTLKEVQKEIKRQAELDLPVYIIQHGDTVEILAEATKQDPAKVAEENGIKDYQYIEGEYYKLTPGEIMTEVVEYAHLIELLDSSPTTNNPTHATTSRSTVNLAQSYVPVYRNAINPNTSADQTTSPQTQSEPVVLEESTPETESQTPVVETVPIDNSQATTEIAQPDSTTQVESSRDAASSVLYTTSQPQAAPVTYSPTTVQPTVEVISEEEINIGEIGEELVAGETIAGETELISDTTETIPGEEYTVTELVDQEVEEEYEEEYTEEVEKEVIDEDGNTTTVTETVIKTRPATRTVTKQVEQEVTKQDEIEVKTTVEETIYTVTPATLKKYDDTLDQGEEELIQAGENGSYKVITTTVYRDGVQQSRSEEIVDRIEPTQRVVKVGTKNIIGKTQQITETTPIPYQTEYTQTDDLYIDQTQVDQEGVDGKIVESYTVTIDNDNHETSREHTGTERIEPVNEIISRGTKTIYTSDRETRTEIIEHDTNRTQLIVHPDETAREVITQEGVDGERTIVDYVSYKYGDEYNRFNLSNTVTKNPVTEKIEEYVPAERQTETKDDVEVIEYVVVEEASEDIDYGSRQKIQDGKNGERRYEVVTEYYIDNDGDKVILEVTKSEVPKSVIAAQDEIWKIGKRIEVLGIENNKRKIKETMPIFYKTQIVKDNNLYTDEEKITTQGVNGEEVLVFEETLDDSNNVISRQEIDRQVTEPVNEVKHVGTKAITTTDTKTRTESVPYQNRTVTQIVAPNQLASSRITTAGQNGVRTIIEEVTYTKGQETDRKVLSNKITKAPITQVTTNYQPAQVYTSNSSRYESVPYQTIKRADSNLISGQETVAQAGSNGSDRIDSQTRYYYDNSGNRINLGSPQVTRTRVSNPTNRIVYYGTKQPQAKYGSVERVLETANKYVGTRKGDSNHKKIIDNYNTISPLPVGYRVKYNDDWCDAFVSSVSKEAGALNATGAECGVERHKKIFKEKGIWKGLAYPQQGDLVVFKWNGDRSGWADHIGFVESVNGDTITTIEGNMDLRDALPGQGKVYSNYEVLGVGKRNFKWNDYRIQGYARPNYRK